MKPYKCNQDALRQYLMNKHSGNPRMVGSFSHMSVQRMLECITVSEFKFIFHYNPVDICTACTSKHNGCPAENEADATAAKMACDAAYLNWGVRKFGGKKIRRR